MTDAQQHAVEMTIAPDWVFFKGHFDGMPVLPGVVQLSRIVRVEIAKTWPELEVVRRVSKLKFHEPILPGNAIQIQLDRVSPREVRFTLLRSGVICTTGIFTYEANG